MCGSIRAVLTCGIILAVIDIFHGMASFGFYAYRLVIESLYLCNSQEVAVTDCHYKKYFYEQMFETRVMIGMGEGIAGILFAIFYIIVLAKRKPSLTWLWLLKSLAVIAINIYYLSSWAIRRGRFEDINRGTTNVENEFIQFGLWLTIAQVAILIFFCVISGIFACMVSQKRSPSKKSLYKSSQFSGSMASAPPLDDHDQERGQYMNSGLSNSQKSLPDRGSKHSLSEINRQDTFKHSTGV